MEEIKHVYHITDINIWHNRHAEYEQVFQHMISSLQKRTGRSLIVITGKLLCVRSIETSALANRLLSNLTKIGTVVLAKQDSYIDIPGVFQVKNRGVYRWDNVSIAYRDPSDNNDTVFGLDAFGSYDYVLASGNRRVEENIISPGPLIQQTSETVYGTHGYQYYNLVTGAVSHVKVKNPYGYVSIVLDKGQYTLPKMPKHVTIRYLLDNTDYRTYLDISKQIALEYDVVASTVTTKLEDVTETINVNTILDEYFDKFSEKEKLLEIHQRILDKVTPIRKSTTHGKWRILKLEFDNTISYGKGNVIDFSNYDTNSVIGIVAPNRYGKTAIMDIILFCLFEKISRGTKSDIMNKACHSFACALTFESGDTTYRIARSGKMYNDKLRIDSKLYKNGLDYSGQSKSETNRRMEAIIGSYDDYMATYFHLARDKGQFIDMSQPQKKEYIFDLLRISDINQCHTVAKAKLKKYQAVIKTIQLKPGLLVDNTKRIQAIDREIRSLEAKPDWDIIIFDPPSLPIYPSLTTYRLTLDNISQVIQTTQTRLTSLGPLKSELSRLQKTYTDLSATIDQIKESLKPLRIEYDNLISQLVHIPPDYDQEQLDYLKDNEYDTEFLVAEINHLTRAIKPVRLSDCDAIKNKLQTMDGALIDAYQNIHQLTKSQASVLVSEIQYNEKLLNKLDDGSAKDFCENHLLDLKRKVTAAQNNLVDRRHLSNEIKRMRELLVDHWCDRITDFNNKRYERRLQNLKANLKTAKRKEYLLSYEPQVKRNEHIKARMAQIKPILFGTEIDSKEAELKSLRHKITQIQSELDKSKTLAQDLRLMRIYELQLIHWHLKKTWQTKWSQRKTIYDKEKMMRQSTLIRLRAEKKTLETEIKQYIDLKTQHTRLSTQINCYQHYVNATHPNGIQYEIIKRYLPMIQYQVNQILQNVADFTIAFEYDKTDLAIMILANHRVSAQMASGYERFVISIALMIVLGRIAMNSKPNFIIIDEGWSKVDADNRCKLANTMSFIKSQCDHIIMISNDSSLIAEPDHSIEIIRRQEMSYINSSEPLV